MLSTYIDRVRVPRRRHRVEKHAVYAVCTGPAGREVTLRVGQPVRWGRAIARWQRLNDRRLAVHPGRIRHDGCWYTPRFYEVRAVDPVGRGLGSERHTLALPVPYRNFHTL
jgi:hypothetical protein